MKGNRGKIKALLWRNLENKKGLKEGFFKL
jgi:hypothetical protein